MPRAVHNIQARAIKNNSNIKSPMGNEHYYISFLSTKDFYDIWHELNGKLIINTDYILSEINSHNMETINEQKNVSTQ